jgi:5-methyltetrahydrofolate--homocysteine methyltransferase
MGTQLLAKGMTSGECGMLWNVQHPEIVRGVHEAYLNSGCDLITTNTFGGSSFSLEHHGLSTRMTELNHAGAQNARQISGNAAWVLGDIGPFGDFLEPLGDTTEEELHDMFRAQARALIEGGADALLVETMSDPAEVEVAIAAIKDCGGLPIIATYAFQKTGDSEFRTMMGAGVEDTVGRSIAAGARIVGANCGTALAFPDYLELARQLVLAAGKTPVILQPNAGAPVVVGENTVYRATPDEMAAIVQPLLDLGVQIIGGCCGTSPAHLAAMRRALPAK